MSAKVVHISDLHIEPVPEERFPGLTERLGRDRIRLQELAPDLVVVTGDLTNWGSSQPADLELAKEWLDDLGLPVLVVPGNHDLGSVPHRGLRNPRSEAYHDGPFATSGYASVFGSSPVTRADLDGLTVLGIALREGDPDGAIELLAQQLDECAVPVLVAGHFPVVPTRDVSFSREFGSEDYLPNAVERLRVLLASTAAVIGYLCGHVHIISRRTISPGCEQFSAGGLGSGSSHFRIFELVGDELRYETMVGHGPSIFWEREFDVARADPAFSTGTANEQAGTIALERVQA